MGSLCYLAWCLWNRRYDANPYDIPVLCLLFSLDCQLWFRAWVWRRGN